MSIEAILGMIGSFFGISSIVGSLILWKRQVAIEKAKIALDIAQGKKADSEADSITLASAVVMIHELREEVNRANAKIDYSNVKIETLQVQVGTLQTERVEILRGVRLLIGQLEEKGIDTCVAT